MSKTKEPTKSRNTVSLDPDLVSEMNEIVPKIGADSVASLTRMSLRHIFTKIKAGELVNLNGNLVPNPAKAA